MIVCSKRSRAALSVDEAFSSFLGGRHLLPRSGGMLSEDASPVTSWLHWQAGSVDHAQGIHALVEAMHNTPPQVDTSLYRNKEAKKCGKRKQNVPLVSVPHRFLHLSSQVLVRNDRNADHSHTVKTGLSYGDIRSLFRGRCVICSE